MPNGQSTRHPDANRFIDNIRERLHQAIQNYEQTSLGTIMLNIIFIDSLFVYAILSVNIGNDGIEIDHEARKALNFIETGQLSNGLSSFSRVYISRWLISDTIAYAYIHVVSSTDEKRHYSNFPLCT
jgi:hypothetical protein